MIFHKGFDGVKCHEHQGGVIKDGLSYFGILRMSRSIDNIYGPLTAPISSNTITL